MVGGRYALLVGVSDYDDPGLSELRAPAADIEALQKVLEAPEKGAFDRVTPLVDPDRGTFLDALSELFENRAPDDFVLLYFSGHGVVDARNRFFFAVKGTRLRRLWGTAVHYDPVYALMDDSAARGQLVILDCCHAGAFDQRARAATGQKALDQDVAGSVEEHPGAGRWVLAATDATSFAFEKDDLVAEAEQKPALGVFTRALVEGLDGAAGPPDAAWITAQDLFTFAAERVRRAVPAMRPQHWVAKGSTPLRVAKKRPQPKLPAGLAEALRDANELLALGALHRLTGLFNGADPALAAEAERTLRAALAEPGPLLHVVGKEIEKVLAEHDARAAPPPSSKPAPKRRPKRPPPRPEPPPTTSFDWLSTTTSASSPPDFTSQLSGVEPSDALRAQFEAAAKQIRESTFAGAPPSPDLAALRSLLKEIGSAGAESRKPLEVFRDIDAPWCPEMVVIPAGTFLMGSPEGEKGRFDDEGPQHEVTVRSFALGRYPVTFDEYDHFCDEAGRAKANDQGWGRGRRPVINVSWDDAKAYVTWLAEATGKPYRLPSEAEWEYACRAGTTTPFSTGDCISKEKANFNWQFAMTTPVDAYPAIAWGLCDMHGNVSDWVEDCWHETYEGAPFDGSAWLDANNGNCDRRVVRGGSWFRGPEGLRSALRLGHERDHRIFYLGFRVARTPIL